MDIPLRIMDWRPRACPASAVPRFDENGFEKMIRYGVPDFEDRSRDILEEAAGLARLAEDFRFVAKENRPNSSSDVDAPVLEDWRLIVRPVPCLAGLSTGHPLLIGDRRQIVTSEVHLISEELGWVRTRSRWYRLGRRVSENSRGK